MAVLSGGSIRGRCLAHHLSSALYLGLDRNPESGMVISPFARANSKLTAFWNALASTKSSSLAAPRHSKYEGTQRAPRTNAIHRFALQVANTSPTPRAQIGAARSQTKLLYLSEALI